MTLINGNDIGMISLSEAEEAMIVGGAGIIIGILIGIGVGIVGNYIYDSMGGAQGINGAIASGAGAVASSFNSGVQQYASMQQHMY